MMRLVSFYMGRVCCKQKNCKYRRKRKTSPYGMSSGKSWHCPCDGLWGPNYEDPNPARERQKAKKEIKEEQ